MNRLTPALLFYVVATLLAACEQRTHLPPLSAADSTAIVAENLRWRASRETFFRTDPGSPFVTDSSVTFEPLRWYPVDPHFRATSLLHRYDDPPVVNIYGTGGEVRRHVRYGFFEFSVPDSTGKPVLVRLNVYKTAPDSPYARVTRDLLSVWFTDETTGFETYGVGRYVDVGNEDADPGHLYTIDLNKAYNPWCAYSPSYTCAVPSKEDHIPQRITAGELTYHH